MPDSSPRYCAIGVFWADNPDAIEVLCIEGKVVLFDTVQAAREVIPRLGSGRIECWDATQEKVTFVPMVTARGFNRLWLLTNYDPYDIPNGLRRLGIWSEAKGRDWKYHTIAWHVIGALVAWADQTNDAAMVIPSVEEQEAHAHLRQ